MNIEVRRPFTRDTGKARFRATYLVSDVPSPGCVQVTVTLATRIQLAQQIAKEGIKYSESLLAEISKELVKDYVAKGGELDPECSTAPNADAIFLDYGDFDMLLETASNLSEVED